jgi:DNA-binding MarR family transcriptional regulator
VTLTVMPDDDFDALVDDALYASRAFVALAVRTLSRSSASLTMPQHRALLELALRGPQSLSSMGSLLGMPPSGTSRLCDRLIRRGLMQKRQSPKSRRAIELSVTDRGLAEISSILDARRRELAEALAKVPDDDREAFRDALNMIAATLGEPRELLTD